MKTFSTLFLLFILAMEGQAQFSCAGAVPISSGYSTGTITTGGSNNFITSATVGSCSGSASYYTTGDNYVYTFTTGNNAAGYILNSKITTNNTRTIAGLFTTCSGTSLSGCVAADYNFSTTPEALLVGDCSLLPNATYYLVISRDAAGGNALSFSIDYFTLKTIDGTEASDECSTATAINFTTAYSGITAACYTPSSQSYCWGSLDNDSWIEFTATATTIEFDYSLSNCSNPSNGIQFAVYNSCGGSDLDCEGGVTGTGTYTVNGLTIGNTYLLRIDGWAGNVCEFNLTPSTGVAVTPPNDNCANAETLTCGGSDTESNIMANDTDAPTACTGGGTTGKGVWYAFTGTGQNVTVSTDNAGTNFDTQINIYTGPCGSVTCVGGDDDSGSGTTSSYTFYAVSGTDYLIYVDGDGSAEGQFEISISCAACNANAGTWN